MQSKKWKLLIFERQDNEIFYAATLVENDCAPEMIFLQTTYRQHLKNSKPSRASQRQDERAAPAVDDPACFRGQADQDAEDYITETLLKAIFKFRMDRVSPPFTTE